MDQGFDIQAYMTHGVERVVGDIVRATFRNPRESAYMAKFALASRAASRKRRKAESEGEHIPPFLIASITSQCNLHCAGCYSRCNHATVDGAPVRQLSAGEWERIFEEADGLGISFVLLAGGEPMIRRDVIEAAGKHPGILFPVFTNGTYMDEAYFRLFERCRNLVPVMSIEGEKETTDARRGRGVYDRLIGNMDALAQKELIFGASVTVTTRNIREVSSGPFLKALSDRGCKAVIFVEFVPVTEDSADLAPGDPEREYLSREIARLREEHPEMVYISFPGDEKSSGGCVAAGRGFFHINSHGGAEPCPFSPYSDINVRDTSLREALQSPLFRALQGGGLLDDDHAGGCVLYQKRALVEALLNKRKDGRKMIYDYTITTGKGEALNLADYKGKVIMVVNTATGCGFTPQYAPIEQMYRDYHDQGLEILDIPCNQFGGQAPGTDEEIHEFCTMHFNTTFPQMKKADVNGPQELPLYTYLKSEKGFAGLDEHPYKELLENMFAKADPDWDKKSDIKWNFTKFVIDRDGKVVARFEPTADMAVVEACVKSLL